MLIINAQNLKFVLASIITTGADSGTVFGLRGRAAESVRRAARAYGLLLLLIKIQKGLGLRFGSLSFGLSSYRKIGSG